LTKEHYLESLKYNTCLNRKLCIDFDGYIKNCPAMEKIFGNIKNTSLKEAIQTQGFKNLWKVNKDKIDVCKDCEFRYICTDCRCFIKNKKNIFSQPSKCAYNPYICKWSIEATYVPVEECGTYNNKGNFTLDQKKIEILNKQIWDD
jgi:SPASM domain peptide maturase of grasp-with-spasm system